jgi:alpha-tubulin suppressor-like RCC1 family protein
MTLQFNGVSPGSQHTCGVTTDKVAHCWGWNAYGQLGDGTTTERHKPVAVAGAL